MCNYISWIYNFLIKPYSTFFTDLNETLAITYFKVSGCCAFSVIISNNSQVLQLLPPYGALNRTGATTISVLDAIYDDSSNVKIVINLGFNRIGSRFAQPMLLRIITQNTLLQHLDAEYVKY